MAIQTSLLHSPAMLVGLKSIEKLRKQETINLRISLTSSQEFFTKQLLI